MHTTTEEDLETAAGPVEKDLLDLMLEKLSPKGRKELEDAAAATQEDVETLIALHGQARMASNHYVEKINAQSLLVTAEAGRFQELVGQTLGTSRTFSNRLMELFLISAYDHDDTELALQCIRDPRFPLDFIFIDNIDIKAKCAFDQVIDFLIEAGREEELSGLIEERRIPLQRLMGKIGELPTDSLVAQVARAFGQDISVPWQSRNIMRCIKILSDPQLAESFTLADAIPALSEQERKTIQEMAGLLAKALQANAVVTSFGLKTEQQQEREGEERDKRGNKFVVSVSAGSEPHMQITWGPKNQFEYHDGLLRRLSGSCDEDMPSALWSDGRISCRENEDGSVTVIMDDYSVNYGNYGNRQLEKFRPALEAKLAEVFGKPVQLEIKPSR